MTWLGVKATCMGGRSIAVIEHAASLRTRCSTQRFREGHCVSSRHQHGRVKLQVQAPHLFASVLEVHRDVVDRLRQPLVDLQQKKHTMKVQESEPAISTWSQQIRFQRTPHYFAHGVKIRLVHVYIWWTGLPRASCCSQAGPCPSRPTRGPAEDAPLGGSRAP